MGTGGRIPVPRGSGPSFRALLRLQISEGLAVHGGDVAAAAGILCAHSGQWQEAVGGEVAQRWPRGSQCGQEELRREEQRGSVGGTTGGAPPCPTQRLSSEAPFAPTSVTSSGSWASLRACS